MRCDGCGRAFVGPMDQRPPPFPWFCDECGGTEAMLMAAAARSKPVRAADPPPRRDR